MADIEITVDSGTSKRLLTGGKYCDRNITVTATGGGGEPEPPDDGKTRLYITVPANSMPDRPPPRNQVPLYIQQNVDRGVTIDWGDGTPTETLPGTGSVDTTHTYEQAGDYVISLDPADGCELGLGNGSSSYCVMGSTSDNSLVYCSMLKRAVIGSRGLISINEHSFRNCYSLSYIFIHYGIKSIGSYAFYNCSSLSFSFVPDSVTSIGVYAFNNCYSISSISIPEGVTSIGAYAFINCYSISSISIPEGVASIETNTFRQCRSMSSIFISGNVTSIGNYAFGNCPGVKEYHLLPTTPPSLSNTNAFNDIPSDCVIYVPVGSLEAYQTATNWSAYADQMQEEPA